MADGNFVASVTATELAGKTATVAGIGLTVQNGDFWRDVRAASPFLLLLVVLAASVLFLLLGRRGTLAEWARPRHGERPSETRGGGSSSSSQEMEPGSNESDSPRLRK
jgi:hypothetical protein